MMTTREEAIAAVLKKWEAQSGAELVEALASSAVDALRESGLLNDQRYEQATGDQEYGRRNGAPVIMVDGGDEPLFRKVDVPGETP